MRGVRHAVANRAAAAQLASTALLDSAAVVRAKVAIVVRVKVAIVVRVKGGDHAVPAEGILVVVPGGGEQGRGVQGKHGG